MKLLLELSMECESLARAEAVAAGEALGGSPRVVHFEPGVLILDYRGDPVALASRLALCHNVSEWAASCQSGEVDACAGDLHFDGPIRVRSTKVGDLKMDLAAVTRRIGAIVARGGKVDLSSPKTDMRVVFSKKAHMGRALASIDRPAFERRKNRYMPYFYPASLHPKFARALVNLTRVPPGGKLLDPFCGTGAIVAEASLVGLEAIGTDFSEKMIEGAARNLAHLKTEASLRVCDVGEVSRVVGEVSGVATDPPYGRATTTEGEKLSDLYARSFRSFSEVLPEKARIAIVVPEMRLLRDAGSLELIESHSLWVHRSLTRHFCVMAQP